MSEILITFSVTTAVVAWVVGPWLIAAQVFE